MTNTAAIRNTCRSLLVRGTAAAGLAKQVGLSRTMPNGARILSLPSIKANVVSTCGCVKAFRARRWDRGLKPIAINTGNLLELLQR
jgi:hypothetical protein